MKRYYLVVDMMRAGFYGLNPSESLLASYLYGLIAQVKPLQYDGEYFYRAPYQWACDACPMLPQKADTIQRLYKRLESVGLIRVVKIDGQPFFSPSKDLREWGCEFTPGERTTDERADERADVEQPQADAATPEAPRKADKRADEIESTDRRKTLFKNSPVAGLMTVNPDGSRDYTALLHKFPRSEYGDVDIVYYFHAVADWSDSSGTKRTPAGWLATIRNFIRGDRQRGQVHTITQTGGFDVDAALKYLNNDF